MARKKSKQSARKLGPSTGETPRSSISPSSSSLSSSAAGIANMTPSTSAPPASTSSRKSSAKSSAAPSSGISPPLLISRNKHWKFISCFHGSWLQMPFEVLEAIAHINYNTILPRPVDPGCLFDILRVRRLFEEATNLAVRAAGDIASPMLTNVNAGLRDPEPMGSLLMGAAPAAAAAAAAAPHGARLSKERKFRMREQACQKLARAYRLDEIACSVATMQGASPLGDIGKLVLQRSPADPDARYVDFFHEKIPSRRVAQSTSLLPLTDILSDRPGEPEVLRTRALVKVFQRDFEGAIQDLTHALSVHRFVNPASHGPKGSAGQKNAPSQGGHPPGGTRRRPNDVLLTEKEQPSSFESQILFQRATAYFALACEHLRNGMPMPEQPNSNGPLNNAPLNNAPLNDEPTPVQDPEKQAESRRFTRSFARRALKDYMAFISRFHYSPDYPIKAIQEYTDRVANLTHSTRTSRDPSITLESHAVYPLSELFAPAAATTLHNLPPFPPPPDVGPEQCPTPPPVTTCEWLTFHPLITDVLHSLLLCHLLVQTPAPELQRHAYMAARLLRLADGFPIFQAARSPSRADWLEVLRRAGNWLRLADSWENLTSPLLIPFFCTEAEQHKIVASASHMCPAPCIASAATPAPHEHHAMQDHAFSPQTYNTKKTTLNNISTSTSTSTASTQSATVTANKPANPKPNASPPAPPSRDKPPATDPAPLTYEDTLSKWIAEDSREYPILTDRAAFLTRWLQEAPTIIADASTGKRKKRPARPARGHASRPKNTEGGHDGKSNGKENEAIRGGDVPDGTAEALASDIGRLNV